MEYSYRIMVLFDCEMCNPNADPEKGEPRIREIDNRGFITPQAIKYKVKKWFNHMEYPVLHYMEDSEETVKSRILGKDKKLDESELVKRALEYIDVRLFGALDMSGDFVLKIKGPVSVGEAMSHEPVNVIESNINRGYMVDVEVSDNGNIKNKGSTYNNERKIVDYGLYSFFSGVDSRLGVKTGVTDEDIEKLIDAYVHLFDIDYSCMRPLGSMLIRNVVVWKWKGIKKVTDSQLMETVKVHIRNTKTQAYNRTRYEIEIEDCSGDDVETYIY